MPRPRSSAVLALPDSSPFDPLLYFQPPPTARCRPSSPHPPHTTPPATCAADSFPPAVTVSATGAVGVLALPSTSTSRPWSVRWPLPLPTPRPSRPCARRCRRMAPLLAGPSPLSSIAATAPPPLGQRPPPVCGSPCRCHLHGVVAGRSLVTLRLAATGQVALIVTLLHQAGAGVGVLQVDNAFCRGSCRRAGWLVAGIPRRRSGLGGTGMGRWATGGRCARRGGTRGMIRVNLCSAVTFGVAEGQSQCLSRLLFSPGYNQKNHQL